MKDIVVNDVHIFNPIEGKKEMLIEYFVKVYGEEHRPLIEEKINSIVFITVPTEMHSFSAQRGQCSNAKGKLKKLNVEGNEEEILAEYQQLDEDFKEIEEKRNEKIFSLLREKWKGTALYKNIPQTPCRPITSVVFFDNLLSIISIEKKQLPNLSEQEQKALLRALKSFGLNYDSYQSFLQDTDMIDLLFDNETNKQIINIFDEAHLAKFEHPAFQDILSQAGEIDACTGNLSYYKNIYNKLFVGGSGGTTFMRIDSNGKLIPVIVFSDALSLRDSTIIHEINHAIASEIVTEKDGVYTIKSGFHIGKNADYRDYENYDGKNVLYPSSPQKRPDSEEVEYSEEGLMFDEALTELIARDVMAEMDKDGVSVTLQKDKELRSEYPIGLISEFYQKNKDVILRCRLSKDPYALVKIMGEKDYYRLLELAENYMSFSPEEYKQAKQEVHEISERLYQKTHQDEREIDI